MVKISDSDIVDLAASVFEEKVKNKTNEILSCGIDTEFLIDGGRRDSIILDRAMRLVNSAVMSVDFMSSRPASGPLKKALFRAVERGVKVRTYSSKVDSRAPFESYAPKNGRAHAKLIVADNTAIFGSHNFDWKLVALQTEELSLQTHRQYIVKPLKEYFEKTISEA